MHLEVLHFESLLLCVNPHRGFRRLEWEPQIISRHLFQHHPLEVDAVLRGEFEEQQGHVRQFATQPRPRFRIRLFITLEMQGFAHDLAEFLDQMQRRMRGGHRVPTAISIETLEPPLQPSQARGLLLREAAGLLLREARVYCFGHVSFVYRASVSTLPPMVSAALPFSRYCTFLASGKPSNVLARPQ